MSVILRGNQQALNTKDQIVNIARKRGSTTTRHSWINMPGRWSVTFLCVQLTVFCHPDFASRTVFFFLSSYFILGFPGGSDGKASARNVGPWFDPWDGKTPWRRKWQPTTVFLPRKSHGQRTLVGYSHGVAKSRTRLSNFTFVLEYSQLTMWLFQVDSKGTQPYICMYPFYLKLPSHPSCLQQ